MNIVWQFLVFWFQCVVDGFFSIKTNFGVIKTILGILTAALYFHGKSSKAWEKWEKPTTAALLWIFVILGLFDTLFIAPFKQYYAERSKIAISETADFFERNRPRLEPVLIVDEIDTNGPDQVDYHLEIVNKGILAAENVKQSITGRTESQRQASDDTLKSKMLECGSKLSFTPPVWVWEPGDLTWKSEMTVHYECVISGKRSPITSKYTFKIERWVLRAGTYFPERDETDFVPEPPRDINEDFLSASDKSGSYVFGLVGKMPVGYSSNAVRQLFFDGDTNTIRFYFQTESGKKVELTNNYVQGEKATNTVAIFWGLNGAALGINGQLISDPPEFSKIPEIRRFIDRKIFLELPE